MELAFADRAKLKKRGISFNCEKCPASIQKLRRCHEDRENFEEKDNSSIWPMYITDGGTPFGFCPGKATWEPRTVKLYRMLVICADTGALYEAGGISDQPEWFVDLLGWFLPRYNDLRFYSRAKAILGDEQPKIPGR